MTNWGVPLTLTGRKAKDGQAWWHTCLIPALEKQTHMMTWFLVAGGGGSEGALTEKRSGASCYMQVSSIYPVEKLVSG